MSVSMEKAVRVPPEKDVSISKKLVRVPLRKMSVPLRRLSEYPLKRMSVYLRRLSDYPLRKISVSLRRLSEYPLRKMSVSLRRLSVCSKEYSSLMLIVPHPVINERPVIVFIYQAILADIEVQPGWGGALEVTRVTDHGCHR